MANLARVKQHRRTVPDVSVEPYTIYGGNPAKFIKKRFSNEIIELLLKLQWWNWDEEKIFDNLEKLTSARGLEDNEMLHLLSIE